MPHGGGARSSPSTRAGASPPSAPSPDRRPSAPSGAAAAPRPRVPLTSSTRRAGTAPPALPKAQGKLSSPAPSADLSRMKTAPAEESPGEESPAEPPAAGSRGRPSPAARSIAAGLWPERGPSAGPRGGGAGSADPPPPGAGEGAPGAGREAAGEALAGAHPRTAPSPSQPRAAPRPSERSDGAQPPGTRALTIPEIISTGLGGLRPPSSCSVHPGMTLPPRGIRECPGKGEGRPLQLTPLTTRWVQDEASTPACLPNS